MDSTFIQTPARPQGAWLIESEQDFCYGAKTSSHPYPGASTPSSSLSPNYYDSPIWIEESDNFNWNKLEAFSDVLLPEHENFGPDDLFKGISHQTGDVQAPIPPKIWEEQTEDASIDASNKPIYKTKPKITIKLKRVKKSTSKPSEHLTPEYSSTLPLSPPKYELLPSPNPSIASPNNLNFAQVDFFSDELAPLKEETVKDFKVLKEELCLSPHRVWGNELSPRDAQKDHQNELDVFQCSNELMGSLSSYENPNVSSEPSDMSLIDLIDVDDANHLLDEFLDGSKCSETENSDQLLGEIEQLLSPMSENGTSTVHDSDYTSSDSSVTMEEPVRISKNKPQKAKRSNRRAASPETRYNNKKEQNKQAAHRYRTKKRKGDDNLLGILRKEEEKHAELKETYSNLKKELNFMKKLMREAFIVKGMVSVEAFKAKKASKSF